MSAEEAQVEKTAGSAAWTQGQYDRAVEHFSKAISLGGSDKEFLKVIYSNRSAAYHKLNKLQQALDDANKCIEVDSQWSKGYSRKGDALYALRRFTDSYNAYNSGLRYASGDATLREKVDLAMRAIQSEADSTASNSSTTSSDQSTLTRYLKLAIIGLAVLYLIPFLPRFISSTAYK
ncbi:tetratricopeptide repeat protein [archaeon]|nr:MAG: tetratricopeptide repeat protein [archaeon]